MTYLGPLRLHFAGKFQAAVSTVNNDPVHYDTQTFQPSYQQMTAGAVWNGWWNPRGDASWRLIGCHVTAAWLANGSAAAPDDPILHCLIADSDRAVAAKLADLDPEQQLASEIWGMEVRITDAIGTTLARGRFAPAPFIDIWDRYPKGHGDLLAGAMYQSVLTDLEWGEIGGSPFLRAIKDAASDGLLSIKFNVDSYITTFNAPDFTLGRIAGTIGPATTDEPRHFVPGRQFMTTGLPSGNFFAPAGGINFCVATVNPAMGKIYLDLGNALPIEQAGGPPLNLGTLSVICEIPSVPPEPSEPLPIGAIPATIYTDPSWYPTTAGVVALPADRQLTADELSAIGSNPLAILLPPTVGSVMMGIAESPGGQYVRADQFVYRLNPGEKASVQLYATQFGAPYPDARIISILDPNELQPGSQIGQAPNVAIPIQAIDFPSRVTADASGTATLPIRASDPGNPRGYIDGQVYGVRPMLEETVYMPGMNHPFNQWNFISLLVWDAFTPDEPPTWYGSMQPIFQQYANLYPVMSDFLDLADYDAICTNRRLLLLAFGLEDDDPNVMPATHDLSAAKRRAIIRWLSETGPDGNPLKGNQPPAVAAAVAPAVAPAPTAIAPSSPDLFQAGKAAAASRRLGLRRLRR